MPLNNELPVRDLIAALCRGDHEAWRIFLEKYGKLLYFSINQKLRAEGIFKNSHLEDDIYQEVLHQILEKNVFAKIESPECFKAYLIRMTLNETVRQLMKRKSEASISAKVGNTSEVSEDVATLVLKKDLVSSINAFVKNLSQKEELVIRLFYEQELTQLRISEVLGVPINTVSTILHRARLKIREHFTGPNQDWAERSLS